MTLENILLLFIGGGGIGAILSAWFTRKSNQESTEIDLLDRAYIEIGRLDGKIDALEAELREKKTKNAELERIIGELRESILNLREDLDKLSCDDVKKRHKN